MPFARPTLSTLRDQAIQDINAAQVSDAAGSTLFGLLKKSVLRYIAYSIAGFTYAHYGYLDYIALQATPFTATDEYLEGWAALKRVTRKAASSAVITAIFTGTSGRVVPAGSILSRSDGATFTSTADAPVSGASVTVIATAEIPGSSGDTIAGTVMTLGTPISGIQSSGVVVAQITPGSDIETDDELRTRMLQVYANPPQGGDQADYVTWARAVPGVTRAWCNPSGAGPGTVVVYTMFDDAEAAFGGFPQGINGVATNEPRGGAKATGDLLTVANAIYPLRAVTALVYSAAPIAAPQPLIVRRVPSASQSAVSAALAAVFYAEGAPDGQSLVYIDDLEAAIRSVVGGHAELVSPAADILCAVGYLPILGSITWA